MSLPSGTISLLSWRDISLTVTIVSEKSARKILDGVSGYLAPGEILGALGPSGSGKSTLLTVLNRLVEPTQGTVHFAGLDLTFYPITEVRRRIAYIAQRPALFPGTVAENVCYGANLWRLPCNQEFWLQKVNLDPAMAGQPADTLSGGQQQRLALARSLMLEPDILLLDEPTSALDIHSTREIESLVRSWALSENKGVIWVTHDPEQARRVSHRVLFLDEGRTRGCLATSEFFSDQAPEHVHAFLQVKK